jgi:hypothetical protein
VLMLVLMLGPPIFDSLAPRSLAEVGLDSSPREAKSFTRRLAPFPRPFLSS